MARSSRLPSPNPPSPSSSANASPRNSRCSGRRKALIGSCRPEPAPSTVLCATCSPPGIRPCPPTMSSLPHSLSQPEQPPTVSVALPDRRPAPGGLGTPTPQSPYPLAQLGLGMIRSSPWFTRLRTSVSFAERLSDFGGDQLGIAFVAIWPLCK